MGLDINKKYKYINYLIELKEERIKKLGQTLLLAKILYDDYKKVENKDARFIESLVKEIDDCEKGIERLKEEINILMTVVNENEKN